MEQICIATLKNGKELPIEPLSPGSPDGLVEVGDHEITMTPICIVT